MDWSSLFTSAVVAALVSGFVSRRNTERQIQIENITQERAKWREKIRCIAKGVREASAKGESATLEGLRLDLSLNLNPLDKEDEEILSAISEASQSGLSGRDVQPFFDRVSLLLKHDWDRAKQEAEPWPWLFQRSAHRRSYEDFKRRK